MSLEQKGQLKDVCIAKATAFLRNCGSLPLLLGEELLGVFLVQFQLDDTFNNRSE